MPTLRLVQPLPPRSEEPCTTHLWLEDFGNADDSPNHPAALDGWAYWRECAHCTMYADPDEVPATDLWCFVCGEGKRAIVQRTDWSRYPLCRDCYDAGARQAAKGRRVRVA